MWDFFSTVRHRHSVRHYQSDMPVEDAPLHAILEMACAAPSAGDLQAYRIIVVRDPAERAALAAAAENQQFIAEAPVCLVFCADPKRSAREFGERGERLYAIQDTTIAAAYAQLAVVAAGMGSAWIGYFDTDAVRRLLTLDTELEPIALMTIGYPAELPTATPRRRINDVVSFR
ncbi:nitroreductase family protein [Plasticicumulans acidivorans]|uniref:Nitroreductase n=1 Tax=Plasticicumulans acidivorans TaxID=886464 RepID=A0A317MV88_9GAMM|nr:nitroreductase family protein [Plasticicumulans acidivorans]PWV61852.1 nitroreductase [Plasticicumulans acidivorans]